MAKISDYAKTEVDFEDTKYLKSESVVNRDIEIVAVKMKASDKGNYFSIKAYMDGKLISFSCGGVAVVQKIENMLKQMKLNAKEGEIVELKEKVGCMLINKKSSQGRIYYDFV